MIVVDQRMVGVEVLPGLRSPVAPLFGQVLFEAFAQPANVGGLHILKGGVARVVHNHIHNHADATGMGLFHQAAEFLAGAEVGVRAGEVQSVIAMVPIVLEVPLVTTANPAMNLLEGWGDPDGIDAEILQVVQLLCQASKVPAVEGADFILAVGLAAVVQVVVGAAVGKAICHGKVDGRTRPGEALLRSVHGFQQ